MVDYDYEKKIMGYQEGAEKQQRRYQKRLGKQEKEFEKKVSRKSRGRVSYPPKNLNERVTYDLVESDVHRKGGDLDMAIRKLELAHSSLLYGLDNKYNAGELKNLAQATSNRAGRIKYQAEKNHGSSNYENAQDSRQLIRSLEGEFGVTPHRDHWGVAIAVISLVFGLFFLSANITGNVIGNATMGVSNLVGALFFIVGLTQIFFFVRNKK